ncbi:SART-1 family-domain-containing protein, partial [Ostreococcus tauri]
MSALCATVDDARSRALALDGVGACATIAIEGDGEADGADVARVNALDFFRFVQREGDRRGFDAVVGDGRCVPFAMACARATGGSAMDFMTRVGGADLVVNLARGCAEDDDAFDDLIRAGAFEVFIDATLAEEDEVTVRGLVGLACATPRRRALRARLAERGDAVRRLAALMGASADEEIKGFSGGDASAEATKRGAEATYTSKDLRGIKVRHAAEEIAEGRETVLTLRDASVLDEDAEDELENVLMAERASRKKARREATKRATDDPFAEADARDKTVLGKYDAKEDAEAMELDGEGGIDAAEEKRKAEIKARLVAELSGIRGKLDTAEMVKGQQADFHTQEEMQAKFVKREKKKKMRKKLRTKHIDAAELENDAMAPETRDHGSRRAHG